MKICSGLIKVHSDRHTSRTGTLDFYHETVGIYRKQMHTACYQVLYPHFVPSESVCTHGQNRRGGFCVRAQERRTNR